MTKLHEIQRAFKAGLWESDSNQASDYVETGCLSAAQRLNIYRNTFVSTLTHALKLAYPAVERLVGSEFFDGAARIFIREYLPRSAYLNEYSAEFPKFLAQFGPAASVGYLPDVARLEWAVNCALHAPDTESLDVPSLAKVSEADHDLICFEPHPSVQLVHSAYPADTIWRAVLAEDDEALSRVDLAAGPVWLIVERGPDGVDVIRTEEAAWTFAVELTCGRPLGAALQATGGIDARYELAEHLTARRFAGFHLATVPGKLMEKPR